jgi:hypothetical protein
MKSGSGQRSRSGGTARGLCKYATLSRDSLGRQHNVQRGSHAEPGRLKVDVSSLGVM